MNDEKPMQCPGCGGDREGVNCHQEERSAKPTFHQRGRHGKDCPWLRAYQQLPGSPYLAECWALAEKTWQDFWCPGKGEWITHISGLAKRTFQCSHTEKRGEDWTIIMLNGQGLAFDITACRPAWDGEEKYIQDEPVESRAVKRARRMKLTPESAAALEAPAAKFETTELPTDTEALTYKGVPVVWDEPEVPFPEMTPRDVARTCMREGVSHTTWGPNATAKTIDRFDKKNRAALDFHLKAQAYFVQTQIERAKVNTKALAWWKAIEELERR